MARPRDDAPQVRPEDRGKNVYIVVVPRAVPGLEARGFSKLDCGAAGFNGAGDFAQHRDRMCQLAGVGDEAVQSQFEQALGEKPAILCANAELVAGASQQQSSSSP